MAEFDFTQAQRQRLTDEKDKIAQRLRDLADAVDRVRTHEPGGATMREPVTIVGDVTHTVLWGVANLRLDMLASWAQSVYELERYDAAHPEEK